MLSPQGVRGTAPSSDASDNLARCCNFGALPHGGTYLGKAVAEIDRKGDRLIVFTDEQSHDKVSGPKGRGYMVNVASYQHGVGHDAWTRVHGFSEAVIAWIAASKQTMH